MQRARPPWDPPTPHRYDTRVLVRRLKRQTRQGRVRALALFVILLLVCLLLPLWHMRNYGQRTQLPPEGDVSTAHPSSASNPTGEPIPNLYPGKVRQNHSKTVLRP